MKRFAILMTVVILVGGGVYAADIQRGGKVTPSENIQAAPPAGEAVYWLDYYDEGSATFYYWEGQFYMSNLFKPDPSWYPFGVVQAEVYLSELKPTDVSVQLYYGPVDASNMIVGGLALPTLIAQSKGKGKYVFAGAIPCRTSGQHGYALRILPSHEDLGNPFEMGLVLWGG